MDISIDAGGFCTDSKRKYGNYTFTDNLIQALLNIDDKNKYSLYSFCPAPLHLRLKDNWRYKLLLPRKLWLKFRVSLEEILHKHDVFLALNQAVPLYSRAKIISFSHGLSYYYFPQYYRESFIRLSLQLTPMIQKSKYIVVSSQKVKDEMRMVYPDYKKVVVLPFGIPFDMQNRVEEKTKKSYFLYVGMNHPIKNLSFIIKAFKKFNKNFGNNKYKLVFAGTLDMYSSKSDNIEVIPTVSRGELKKLYAQATGYLTASLYESFNLPVLEALSQNCPVVGMESAIIPELASYVNIVSNLNDFVNKMEQLIEKKTVINITQLNKEFSWKEYVKKLVKLY